VRAHSVLSSKDAACKFSCFGVVNLLLVSVQVNGPLRNVVDMRYFDFCLVFSSPFGHPGGLGIRIERRANSGCEGLRTHTRCQPIVYAMFSNN